MKRVLIIFTLLFLAACSTNNKISSFEYNQSSNPWIDAFKDQMFFACLKESYPNDSIFKLIEKRDALNPYDGLDLDNIETAKSLGKKLIENITAPIMCEGCTQGQNYYMATCLHYYKSAELDSIAKSEYEQFKTRNKELYKK